MHAICQHLWHAMDRVLAQPSETSADRSEATSLKKPRKGDGSWTTWKVPLGWMVDTPQQTLELPPHCKVELAKLLDSLCKA